MPAAPRTRSAARPSAFRLPTALAVSLAIIGVAVCATGAGLPPLAETATPNLVLIVTDDQRFDTVDGMPAVRGLAHHGVRFSNAFATTPLCCPSRAGILTGQYSHRSGVLSNSLPDGGAPVFDDRSTLATWLKDAGYTTAMIGKYLNRTGQLGPAYVPPGWDEWHAITSEPMASRYYGYTLNQNGRSVDYPVAPTAHSTTVLSRLALDFVRTVEAPFFLYFAPISPHAPADPAPGAAEKPPAPPTPALPPSFDEIDTSDKPWANIYPRLSRTWRGRLLSLRARIEAALLDVDRTVAAIVDALVARDALDDTVILFTSDNGSLLGEHRLDGKIWPYEESIRVPLVARIPWVRPPGRVDDRLVLNVDLASTLAELAGTSPGIPQDGESLVQLLDADDRGPPWRSAFLIEYLGHEYPFGAPPRYRAVRTRRHLYVEYDNGWRELYDLAADPFELDNLAGRTPELERRLSRRLASLSEDIPA